MKWKKGEEPSVKRRRERKSERNELSVTKAPENPTPKRMLSIGPPKQAFEQSKKKRIE